MGQVVSITPTSHTDLFENVQAFSQRKIEQVMLLLHSRKNIRKWQ